MIVRNIEKSDQVLEFGDPYYTDTAYGSGSNLQPGQWDTNWPGMWDGPDIGFDPNMGFGPGMGCGPGMGFGPGMGWGPGMDFDPNMGPDPGMGFNPNQWNYGSNNPNCSWGSPMPNEMAELLRNSRETNECCRQMLQMMRQMHGKQGKMDAE